MYILHFFLLLIKNVEQLETVIVTIKDCSA